MDVSLYDAKNRLSALLDDVQNGLEIVITRRGKPVARLIGMDASERSATTLAAFQALRDDIAKESNPFTPAERIGLRDEGRR